MTSPKARTATRAPTRTLGAAPAHLTEAQRAAVTHKRGPALVLAGAGTGKTRVLVERIAWLIRHRGVAPQNILALTFTDKAASELEARVDLALPLSALRPFVGTFHAFGETVLREEALTIGLDPRFRILSGPEAWLLLKRNLFSLPLSQYRPLGNPTKFAQALVEFFGAAKDQGITPEKLEEYAAGIGNRESDSGEDAARWKELAATYRAYLTLQRSAGVFDFGDLLLETLRLFRERPEVLRKYRARYPEILVDEFQDTNATQFELLTLLSGPAGNPPSHTASGRHSLLVASDDDQAIFAFRGSNVGHVLAFRERFPRSALIVLTENFRSPQIILDRAYQLIQHNNPYRLEASAGVTKRLISRTETASPAPNTRGVIEHRHFATEEAECAWVAEDIARLVDQGTAYREIAILTRTNAQAGDWVASLLRRDIPHTVSEARGLLTRPEIKDALAYLRLLGNPDEARAAFRLSAHPSLGLLGTDRAIVLSVLRQTRGTVLPVLKRPDLSSRLSPASRPGLGRLVSLLEDHLGRFRVLRPSTVYLEFLERSGILKHAIQETDRHPEVLPNLQAFLAYIRSLEQGLTDGDFLEFLDILEAAADSGHGPPAADLPPETDAVHLLTVHAAKGLEFPVVFVVGATADRYPARGRGHPLGLPTRLAPLSTAFRTLDEREAHVLEERRLFYVALTRAQRRAILTSSTTSAGRRGRRKPSAFIGEAGIPSLPVKDMKPSPDSQLALPLVSAPPPRPGTPSNHALTLSASTIAEYESCPLKYHFHHVLRVPTPPHYTLSFGSTIHHVLETIGTAVTAGNTPTLPEVLRWYEEAWIAEGYESAAHEAARKESGRRALTQYLSIHPELLRLVPIGVEVPFSFPLTTTRITGRIDRLDRTDDPTQVIVTDFKTGEGKHKKAATDTQLSLYSLAARRALGVEPATVRFAYVETGAEDSTTRTAEQDAEVAARVEGIAARIRAGDFHPTPGQHCRFCDFRKICDYAEIP